MPDAVAARLLAHLGSGTLRPNKLRKLVCDAASGVSWTQFAQALEGLRTEGILETEQIDGAECVRVASSTAASSAPPSEHEECVMVPHHVAVHLRRKGRTKLRKIEETTKTQIKLSPFVDNKGNAALTEVQANLRAEGMTVEDAKKRVSACKLFLDKMKKAFKRNPDHFRRQAGGTLEDQKQKVKKKREPTETSEELPKKKRRRYF